MSSNMLTFWPCGLHQSMEENGSHVTNIHLSFLDNMAVTENIGKMVNLIYNFM